MSLAGADPSNYTLANASVSGPVGVIRPASVTVTGLTAQNKVYDGTTSAVINAGSATLSGVISGDDVTLVTAGAVGAFVNPSAGTNKQVDVTGLSLSGTDAGNYTIASPAIATASITPAPLAVTANPATMVYGGTVPTLTYTATGLVGSDTVATALTGSLATTATSKSSVGDYPITQGTLTAVNGDYTITFTGSTLSVTPAPLTITANDVSTVYGAPLPALTASYSGFVNDDTAASLTTPPSLTTPATATSPVGTYPISVSGASSSDYTITYVPGTITVAKAGSSVGLSGSARYVGGRPGRHVHRAGGSDQPEHGPSDGHRHLLRRRQSGGHGGREPRDRPGVVQHHVARPRLAHHHGGLLGRLQLHVEPVRPDRRDRVRRRDRDRPDDDGRPEQARQDRQGE